MLIPFAYQAQLELFSQIFDPPSRVFDENYPEIGVYILHQLQKTRQSESE